MKTLILAGGFGTRLSEYTEKIPKPMVRIGGIPMLNHIMSCYSKYGHNEFFIALGYKQEVIKKYFFEYNVENRNFEINLGTGEVSFFDSEIQNWSVSLIDTGLNTKTGGRIKRLESYLNQETFFLTYGDGISNVDINKLLDFHKSHGKLATVTGVRPSARFGNIVLDGQKVVEFKEKPKTGEGWINGGFFVCEPEIFKYINGDDTDFEKEPLETLSEIGELMVYKHDDFWQCMDSKKDKEYLEDLFQRQDAPWI